ncbi:unnamed protein product, partial [Brachionus calyciflorus]
DKVAEDIWLDSDADDWDDDDEIDNVGVINCSYKFLSNTLFYYFQINLNHHFPQFRQHTKKA